MLITQTLTRIQKLTEIDLQNKTISELYASTAEEYGELARELKIEEKIFGNEYKLPDEGALGESVDLFICAVCMYFATKPRVTSEPLEFDLWSRSPNNMTPNERKFKVFEIFHEAGTPLAYCKQPHYAILLAQSAIDIFFNRGGTAPEFIQLCKKKLDKWEGTQNGTIRSRNLEATP